MTIVRWSPYSGLRSLEREFNRFFDDFGFSTLNRRGQETVFDWMPAADIKENKDNYEIRMELPGVEKDDVKVSLTDDVLVIQGEKKSENKTEEETYHALERLYGSFMRSFRLPGPTNSEKIKAEYKNGVLNLIIPKAENAKAKQIKVE